MTKEFLHELLENLGESCFPIQINWNLEELYIKGLNEALEKTLLDFGFQIKKT